MESLRESKDDLLLESSLGRIYSHLKDMNRPFGIITAFRKEETKEDNLRNNKQLAGLLSNAGYGYFWVDGYFIENAGTPQEVAVKEDSIFVIGGDNDNGRLKGVLLSMVKKYNQDSFLFKPEGSDQAYYVEKSGQAFGLGKWVPNKISQYMTKLRHSKSTFMFESARFDSNALSKRYSKN